MAKLLTRIGSCKNGCISSCKIPKGVLFMSKQVSTILLKFSNFMSKDWKLAVDRCGE
jgi:hypothetical protein